MPLMKTSTTLTANGVATPLVGQPYQTLPFNAAVLFAILADTGATVNASVTSGTDILLTNSPVDILAVASPIIFPDHYTLQDYAMRGEYLNVILQEAAGGTPIVRCNVMVQPV